MLSLFDAASTLASRAAMATGLIRYLPIILPPASNAAWRRAETIARAFRAHGKSNPWIVAALANSYAESGWRAVIAGDKGKSFGPWQENEVFYGASIKAALGIDIETEPDLAKHVEATLWLFEAFVLQGRKPLAAVAAALDAAKTGAEATRIWCAQFERASAAGAVERRVAIAGRIEIWLASLA